MYDSAQWPQRRLQVAADDCQCHAFREFHEQDPLQLRGKSATFKPSRVLPPEWLPSHCAEESGDNYLNIYKSQDGGVAAVLWVLWMLISIALLGLFFRKRKFQPLKFRTFSMTGVLWLNLTYMLTLNLANMAMDFSGSSMIELVVVCICLFIHLFVYIMKSLQLAHMYRWSEMKVTEEPSSLFGPSVLQVKQTRKDLMNYGASWKGMLTVAVLGTIMVVVSRYHVDALKDGDNFYSSVRCQWHTGTESKTSALCPFPSCTQLLVFEDDSPTTAQACAAELNAVCAGPTSEYQTICKRCSSDFSCGCKEEFQDLYSSGECGTFGEIPYFASCRHGYGASPILSGVVSAILLMLVAATIYSYLLIMHIKDKLCLHNECLAAGVVNVICATLIAIYGIYDDFYIQTWRDLSIPLPWLLMMVMSFWALGVSIGYPVFVCYFMRLRHMRSKLSQGDLLTGQRTRKQRSSPSGRGRRKARQDIDALFDPNDEDEMQLRFCLHDKPALRIYLTFAVKELSVENIKFVDKVFELRRQADTADLTEVGRKALQIYQEHVGTGSSMEVNLPGRIRKQLQSIFEPQKARRRSLSGSQRHRGSLSGLSAALGIGNWHSNSISNSHSQSHDRQDSNKQAVVLPSPKSGSPTNSASQSRPPSPAPQTDAGDDRTEVPQWPSSALTDERASTGGMRRSTAQSTVFDVELGKLSPRTGSDHNEPYFPVPTAPNDVLKWFGPAVEEIKRLIIRDSWPRFQQTYRFNEFKLRLQHEDGVESSIRFLLSEDSDDGDEDLGERKTESHIGRRSSEGMRSVPSMGQLFVRRSSTQTVSTVDGGDGLFSRSPSVARRHSADTQGIQNPIRRLLQGSSSQRRSSETLSYLGRLQQQFSFNRRPTSLKIPPVSNALSLQGQSSDGRDAVAPKPRPATAGAALSPREHRPHTAESPTSPRSPRSPRRSSASDLNRVPFAPKERRLSEGSASMASPRNSNQKPTANAAVTTTLDVAAESKSDQDHTHAEQRTIPEIGPIRHSEDRLMPITPLDEMSNSSLQPATDEPPSTVSNTSHGDRSSWSSSNGSPRVILEERSKRFDLGPLSKEPFQPPRLSRRSPQPSGSFSWREVSSAGHSPKSTALGMEAEHKGERPSPTNFRHQPASFKSLTTGSSAEWSGDRHPVTAPPSQHRRPQELELGNSRNRRSLRRSSKERSARTGEWATRDIPVTFTQVRTRTRSAMSPEEMGHNWENQHLQPRAASRSHDWTHSDNVDSRHRLFSGGHETKSDTSSRDDVLMAHNASRHIEIDNRVLLPRVEDPPSDLESQPLPEAHLSIVYDAETQGADNSRDGSESASGDPTTPEVTRKHVRQSNSAAKLFGVLP